MVCLNSSIPVDPHTKMSKSDQINQPHRLSTISACEKSQSAWIDLVIFIAVVSASGFLIYPYLNLLLRHTLDLIESFKHEALGAPMVYGSLGFTIFIASMALLAVALCENHKCGKRGCRGLQKGAEFEIQLLEADNSVKNSSNLGKEGLFELPRDYHKELEAELKKMVPTNGRAILVIRARCGCCVGRMEVPGPKKKNRKIKK